MSLVLRITIEQSHSVRSLPSEFDFTATREISFQSFDDPALGRTLDRAIEAAKILCPKNAPFKPEAETQPAT